MLYCVFAAIDIRKNKRRSPVFYTKYVTESLLIRAIFLTWVTHWFLKKMWETEGNPEKGALDDQRDGLWIQGNV